MPPIRWRIGSTIGGVIAGAVIAFAQSPPPDALARLVALPVSPGVIALLLPHAHQPAAVERISAALADERSEVRAVAARVAFTTKHAAIAPALTRALAKETHPVAGAEIVRSLSLIQGAPADAAIEAALPRLDSRAAAVWTDTIIRTRAGDIFNRLHSLPNREDVGAALASVAASHPQAAVAAFEPLPRMLSLEPSYMALVAAARQRPDLPPWPVLAAGLGSSGRARIATLMLLLDHRAAGRTLPHEAQAALDGIADGAGDLAAAFVYGELVQRRSSGGRPIVDAIGRIDPRSVPPGFFQQRAFANLTTDEAAAVARVAGPDWKRIELPKPARSKAPDVRPVVEPGESRTRLARPQSPALLKDLFRLTGCQAAPGRVAVVDVTYRPTGQVRGLSLADNTTGECAELAGILGALEVAPGLEPVAEKRVDTVVIGLRPTDLECEREPAEAQSAPVRLGAMLEAPVKIRNVAPVYPPFAIERGLQGIVLIEALVPQTGCVADAHVTRRVGHALDVAALAAVGEWRYQPATIDGTPVPVIMTVTVNFTLR